MPYSLDSLDSLITVPELRALRSTGAPMTLIDARWCPQAPPAAERYLAGHLPGAVRADLDADLAAPAGAGGRHPLPGTEEFQATLRRLGVHRSRPVIVYDQRDAMVSARLWWMLRYFGHPDVRVLDGGYEAWTRAGQPVTEGPAEPVAPGDFTAVPGSMPRLTVAEIPPFTTDGFLLDSRHAERFRGEVEPLDPVAGHIPGAVCAPTFDNNDSDGRFLPPERLQDRYRKLGIAPGAAVAAYCGSGVTAANQVLALRLAGFEAALYVGSWSEWITDPARGVAVGP